MTTRLAMAMVMTVAACTSDGGGAGGGGGNGSNRVDDPVRGAPFLIMDAVSAKVSMGAPDSFAMIVMASTPDTCGDARNNVTHPGEQAVSMTLRDVAADTETAPAAPGAYTIYGDSGSMPPKSAGIVFGVLDSSCSADPDTSDQAKSGTVTLSVVSGDVFAGSFDVTTTGGDRIRGSFQPTACPDLQLRVDADGPGTCQ